MSRFLFIILLLIPILGFAGSESLTWDVNEKIDPLKNFYGYVNSHWQKNNPIPEAYPSWNVFMALHKQNLARIKKIVISAEEKVYASPDTQEQKIGDFYWSGMDLKTINSQGIKPLRPEFDRIDQIKDLTTLQASIAHLHQIGVGAVFSFGQMQDFADSQKIIGVLSQGGLGLPDRDYYLKNDIQFQKARTAYQTYIQHLFYLLGYSIPHAENAAITVIKIETRLAKASMSLAEQRGPKAIYHPMQRQALQQLSPHFSWNTYFAAMDHPEINYLNVATPNFFVAMDKELTDISLQEWKIYLRWQLIGTFAPYLSDPFVKETFAFTATLTGVKKITPRWQRVLNAEEDALGYAIGELYVQHYFTEDSKKQIENMVNAIHKALANKLAHLQWMTPATRTAALQKLAAMKERVGYPDKWRDYSKLVGIDRGPYVLNIIRANRFLLEHELNKIGKPVDPEEWEMTPQTINAYYNPSMNRLNIPAGILQPPFFDPESPDAVNYGAIGFVIGHEITHGFDDQGAQFDKEGNLKNWWSQTDLTEFHKMSQKIANQFSSYTVNETIHLKGDLVVGEATADAGGLEIAYNAFYSSPEYKQAKTMRGFTPDQQFFLGAAHVWAGNVRPEEAARLAIIDPHPPALYRVNGTMLSMKEFIAAFFARSQPLSLVTPG